MPIPDDKLVGTCGKTRGILHIEGAAHAILPRIGVIRGTARHGDVNAPIAVPRATDMRSTGKCEGHVRQGQRCRRSIDGDREVQCLRASVRIGNGGHIVACRQARRRGAGLHRAGVPRDVVVAAAPGHHNGDGSVVIAEAGDVVPVRHGCRKRLLGLRDDHVPRSGASRGIRHGHDEGAGDQSGRSGAVGLRAGVPRVGVWCRSSRCLGRGRTGVAAMAQNVGDARRKDGQRCNRPAHGHGSGGGATIGVGHGHGIAARAQAGRRGRMLCGVGVPSIGVW